MQELRSQKTHWQHFLMNSKKLQSTEGQYIFFSSQHSSSERLASLVVQRLKRLPAMWETWVRPLGREDPLEKEMATHSSILARRIPWTEELGGLQSTGRKESDTTERIHFHCYLSVTSCFPPILFPYSSLPACSCLNLPHHTHISNTKYM